MRIGDMVIDAAKRTWVLEGMSNGPRAVNTIVRGPDFEQEGTEVGGTVNFPIVEIGRMGNLCFRRTT